METVRTLIENLMQPGQFFVRPDLPLVWQGPVLEEIPWEVFRGRLLDPAHTRQTRFFTAWSIYQRSAERETMNQLSAEPLLSVKLDEQGKQIHVVRGILCYVWEGIDAGSNVIESREKKKCVRELVGTISLETFPDREDLHHELRALLGAAVQGTSRLPLNSVEAPLPAFSLGQLAYVVADANQHLKDACRDQPLRTWSELLEVTPLSLECLLRSLSPDQATLAVRQWVAKFKGEEVARDLLSQLRHVFTNVSLSPYTDFVATALAFVNALVESGALTNADEIDFWSWLLRQLGRHLTAYDLITFHFRGANYPDALLLDAVLKRYIYLVESRSEFFQGEGASRRLRRRALRQACLLRRAYEGLPVPDAPTSPGENVRVLPAPFVRVPEEQLLNVLRRKKRLYDGDSLPALLSSTARAVFSASILDLDDPLEWRELGAAVFIDRPFGWGKAVGEPDLTPLLAHEAFSLSMARRRSQDLTRLALEMNLDNVTWEYESRHENLQVPGLPASRPAEPDRPIVSLADARRVAPDFVLVRTMRQGLAEVFRVLDFAPLHAQTTFPLVEDKLLLVRLPGEGKETVLAWFDSALRKRLEMTVELSEGYVIRKGVEMPGAGMRVVRLWEENGDRKKVNITIPRR